MQAVLISFANFGKENDRVKLVKFSSLTKKDNIELLSVRPGLNVAFYMRRIKY